MNNRAKKLFITTLTLVLPLFILPEVQAQSPWIEMNSTTKEDLLGVTGGSPTDVFAAGKNGTVRHYKGVGLDWQPLASETNVDLNAVWGDSDKGVFAVGNSGTIRYWYKGIHLTIKKENQAPADLYGVWSISTQIVLAVGGNGTVIRSEDGGKTWKPQNSKTTENLNGIWGTSEGFLFAAGNTGAVIRTEDRGTNWTPLQSKTTENLNAVWGLSKHELFAVGDNGTIIYSQNGGSTWNPMLNPDTKKDKLNGIWGSAKNNIFAVGDNGTILRYNGTEWTVMQSKIKENLNAVWVNHVFIVGQNGFTVKLGGYWMDGYVSNLASCSPLGGATVYGHTSQKEETTQSNGYYEPMLLTRNEMLQFYKSTYQNEYIAPPLLLDEMITNHTYLIPNSGGGVLIAGVLTKQIQYKGNTYLEGLGAGITVNLYVKPGCEWTLTDSTTTANGGCYSFPGLDWVQYKVEPSQTGYTFSPGYYIVSIPQETPYESFDFIRQ